MSGPSAPRYSACDFLGASTADRIAHFGLPLANYVQIERGGRASFSYASQTGALRAVIAQAHRLLQEARGLRRGKAAALKRAEEYLARHVAECELVHDQWDAYLEARRDRSRCERCEPAPIGVASVTAAQPGAAS